ncbi:hypothetical protein KY328_05670 [Candidatus Woesearchaeota archaeon]|nr:hypothetical protein [Candidatus Woesearchaeota archaeon]MBW3022387.1 hypothetical protein [Candidatus Woesearchaeota archaeon]
MDINDIFKLWMQGMSPGMIKKCKKKAFLKSSRLDKIVSQIGELETGKYLEIEPWMIKWPVVDGNRLGNMTFKRYANLYHMLSAKPEMPKAGKLAKGDLKEYELGPQELMKMSFEQCVIIDGRKVRFAQGFDEHIARRGFYYEDYHSNQFVMRQDDIHGGWRLVAFAIANDQPFKCSNPKRGFYAYIPSVNEGFDVKTEVSLTGLPTSEDMEKNYYYWPRIRFGLNRQKGAGDMFEGRPDEQEDFGFEVVNHQRHAALVWYNFVADPDTPYCIEQAIAPAMLNLSIPPTDENVFFDMLMTNNVLVKTKKGTRHLLEGERELFWSVHLWERMFNACYRIDEQLKTKDKVIDTYKWAYDVLVDKPMNPTDQTDSTA